MDILSRSIWVKNHTIRKRGDGYRIQEGTLHLVERALYLKIVGSPKSLDEPIASDSDQTLLDRCSASLESAGGEIDPLDHEYFRVTLHERMECLSEDERRILQQMYFSDEGDVLSLLEVAKRFSEERRVISPARVGQIHGKALRQLKTDSTIRALFGEIKSGFV